MSKKTKTTSKPWKEARPFILGAAQAGQDTWNANRDNIQSMTNQVTSMFPGMLQDYQAGDSGIDAARDYNTDVLSGRYLNEGNPHLDAMIQQTGDNTRNSVQSSLGRRMLTGGSDYAKIMAREMGKNELGMRYQNYGDERARMATAAGQAPGIAAGDAARLQPLLATLGASMTPMQAASGYMGSLGGLLGQYQTQTQSQGLGAGLMGIAGSGLAGWASGGFK